MTRFMLGVLALGMALFAFGCIDYAELIELNADGSGIVSMHMVVHKDYFEGLMSMADMSDGDSTQADSSFSFLSRAEAEKRAQSSNGKVKLIDFKETQSDSSITYDMKYSFTDLKEMLAVTSEVGQDEGMGEPRFKREIQFVKDGNGVWQYLRVLGDSTTNPFATSEPPVEKDEPGQSESKSEADSLAQEVTDGMADMSKAMMQMLENAFVGRTIKLEVKFPGKIIESNATKTVDNTASWEYPFTEMLKSPPTLKASIKP